MASFACLAVFFAAALAIKEDDGYEDRGSEEKEELTFREDSPPTAAQDPVGDNDSGNAGRGGKDSRDREGRREDFGQIEEVDVERTRERAGAVSEDGGGRLGGGGMNGIKGEGKGKRKSKKERNYTASEATAHTSCPLCINNAFLANACTAGFRCGST